MSTSKSYQGMVSNLPVIFYNYKRISAPIIKRKHIQAFFRVPKIFKHTENTHNPHLFCTLYAMIQRCYNENNQSYFYYGARGIKICNRWLNGDEEKSGYDCFAADMGLRPSPKYSIDRIDNNGDYEPGNCRWATSSQQNRNKRKPSYAVYSCLKED